MADSTTLSTRLDPEDLSAVIRGYQTCVGATIARFGGFIARYVGDGELSPFWFGRRSAQGMPERTVRAALAVIAAIDLGPISWPMSSGPHWHRHRLGGDRCANR